MHDLRSNLLAMTIAITTIAMPLCAVKIYSGWLEFSDWWFVLVWGYNLALTLDIRPLGSVDILGIATENGPILSILWTIIGVILITIHHAERTYSIRKRWCVVAASASVIAQVILPIMLLQQGMVLIVTGSLIPLPIPSVILLLSYIPFLSKANEKISFEK